MSIYYKVFFNATYRPEYEILINYYLSKEENKNTKNFSIIEFGVASGKSLKYLEIIVQRIKKKFDIKIDIFGFDTFTGMPKSNNPFDQLYDWEEGDFDTNYEAVSNSLRFSKLIKGDVSDTLNLEIIKNLQLKNVICIFFDLDYYSSTLEAFKIFNDEFLDLLLPRVGIFFDNLHSSTEYSGEYLSIKEFNKVNENAQKHISRDFYLEKFDNRFYQFINFENKNYNNNSKEKQKL